MRYRNIKTGAVIDSSSKIIGKAWELVEKETYHNQKGEEISKDEEVPSESNENNDEEYVEEEVDLGDMTKDQLIKFAKEHEIEINKKDKKPKILDTIIKAFE